MGIESLPFIKNRLSSTQNKYNYQSSDEHKVLEGREHDKPYYMPGKRRAGRANNNVKVESSGDETPKNNTVKDTPQKKVAHVEYQNFIKANLVNPV